MNTILSIILPVFSPFLFSLLALLRGRKSASSILITGAFFHLTVSVLSYFAGNIFDGDGTLFPRGIHRLHLMLDLNRDSRLFLVLISLIFLISSIYFVKHDKIMKIDGLILTTRQASNSQSE